MRFARLYFVCIFKRTFLNMTEAFISLHCVLQLHCQIYCVATDLISGTSGSFIIIFDRSLKVS